MGFNCVAAGPRPAGSGVQAPPVCPGPLVSKPNAGNPTVSPEGRVVYPIGPEEFARLQAEACRMGAGLLGGCCGTTPAYLSAPSGTAWRRRASRRPTGRKVPRLTSNWAPWQS